MYLQTLHPHLSDPQTVPNRTPSPWRLVNVTPGKHLLHLRLLIPSSNHHHISASFPHRVYSKTSSTLSQPHTSTANYQDTSLLPQSPRPARHGIQTLLDAEREASKIVQKAREFRTKRVREARDEAKQEIADYKAKKEDEFQKFGAEHSKGNEQAEAEASKEADKHIKTIKEAGSKGQASVVKNLLSAVFDVKPVAPAKQ
ncbi:hypothetical protein E4U60_001248 [Claviceps pazoutovae]|uniref:V-type proton ATPase subunit G n=1 Tax=Claviceps pazoutovae TaxID=1649127 RepID=A0A9P7MD68_9HYPO|nr:hypothetical protein E4U60_001248 [Claviceps pazoutovae]